MAVFTLDGRVRLSIALALDKGNRGPPKSPDWETEARRLGLCGAEIDVARQGRSFDARTSRAMALALAVGRRNGGRLRDERARAVKSGIPDDFCREIEGFAKGLLAPGSAPGTVPAGVPPD